MVQFDIKTAFLYGKLDEVIYMSIPEGINLNKDGQQYVCRLNKSLYGLKQSPRCWNETFVNFLRKYNFKESQADKCILYIPNSSDRIVIFICR